MTAATQSREQFRGRAEQGRSEMGSMDRGQLQAADRSAGQQRSGTTLDLGPWLPFDGLQVGCGKRVERGEKGVVRR